MAGYQPGAPGGGCLSQPDQTVSSAPLGALLPGCCGQFAECVCVHRYRHAHTCTQVGFIPYSRTSHKLPFLGKAFYKTPLPPHFAPILTCLPAFTPSDTPGLPEQTCCTTSSLQVLQNVISRRPHALRIGLEKWAPFRELVCPTVCFLLGSSLHVQGVGE